MIYSKSNSIFLFQFQNENRMSWIDRHGAEHPLTVIGNNNCDAKKPFLVTDRGEITDLEKLPILAIAYGPLSHEAENMSISIGPLVCEPPVADQESNINERFESLESKINDTIIKIDAKHEVFKKTQEKMQEDLEKSKMRMDEIEDVLDGHNNLLKVWKCPTSKPNYRSIENRCYYFETTFKSYDDAKQNCNTKFPQGKLFEPKSSSSNKKVHKVALSIKWASFWIGITDKRSEGNWVYDSDGASVAFSIQWYTATGQPNPNGGSSENCLIYYSHLEKWIGQMGDNICSSTYPSICEQIV